MKRSIVWSSVLAVGILLAFATVFATPKQGPGAAATGCWSNGDCGPGFYCVKQAKAYEGQCWYQGGSGCASGARCTAAPPGAPGPVTTNCGFNAGTAQCFCPFQGTGYPIISNGCH